ncbi:VOC family protein [Methylobacterium nodulans]|uniref:Glyoxalase/bleomycin resistance protein/dioxygenase n=1 Tax=Methylobacterium nodulans (strain LMG 21967 / CNCM I-2342 / ORS 2060) TaxID=460265 RepID=B8IWN4_METNO|nr:VOC family protein [Methylobacterium nodulans]ACL62925.1 Glyoxalase/bleomycin resistance protein/dioxygenase [Methylobacterium nodulans ORS 2060]
MYSHIVVGTDDLQTALAFYDRVLAVLGLRRIAADDVSGAIGYAADGGSRAPMFFVGPPLNGCAAAPGNGTTVAFLAQDEEVVRQWHAAALAAGGSDEGPPGLRPQYHPGYYAAYSRDPDGNKLCCVFHG